MIIAIDIGTTSAKAALFERDGSCRALERVELPPPIGKNPMEQEIAPETWLSATRSLLASLASQNGSSLSNVECVVVSGHGPTIVPVGNRGEILHNAISWMDRRAVLQAEQAKVIIGRYLDPAFNLPKILWIREKLPEVYTKTRWFASCPEFVVAHLCGVWVSFLPADGYQEIIWDDTTLDLLGLDKDKFPPFAKIGTIVGTVSAEAAESTGLRSGTAIVAGGPDFIVSLIGTATVSPRRVCDRSGTSEGINLCWNGQIARDPRLLYMPHVVSPYINISGVISTTGRAIQWCMDTIGGGAMKLEDYYRLVSSAPEGAGALLFLPYLTGERAPLWNPKARGAFIGLSLRHGAREMARAVAESTGFAMRDVISVMESTGARVDDLRVTGQPSGNPILNQIKADITGKPILSPSFKEAELLGDLCLALVALSEFDTIEEAAEKMVRFGEIFEPNLSTQRMYGDLFQVYTNSYKALESSFDTLAAIGSL
jgi:xylulokinase